MATLATASVDLSLETAAFKQGIADATRQMGTLTKTINQQAKSIKPFADMLKGAGALAGATLILNKINHGLDDYIEIQKKLAAGEISAATASAMSRDAAIKMIPVLGQMYDATSKLVSILDGTAKAEIKAARNSEMLAESVRKRIAHNKELAASEKAVADAIQSSTLKASDYAKALEMSRAKPGLSPQDALKEINANPFKGEIERLDAERKKLSENFDDGPGRLRQKRHEESLARLKEQVEQSKKAVAAQKQAAEEARKAGGPSLADRALRGDMARSGARAGMSDAALKARAELEKEQKRLDELSAKVAEAESMVKDDATKRKQIDDLLNQIAKVHDLGEAWVKATKAAELADKAIEKVTRSSDGIESLRQQVANLSPGEKLVADMEKAKEAVQKALAEATDPASIDRLAKSLNEVKNNIAEAVKLTGQESAQKAAEERAKKLVDMQKRIAEASKRPMDEYLDQLAQANELLARGLITKEQFANLDKKARKELAAGLDQAGPTRVAATVQRFTAGTPGKDATGTQLDKLIKVAQEQRDAAKKTEQNTRRTADLLINGDALEINEFSIAGA